ncbi:hypothetical protein HZA96_00915 [Candidatus Woesearchaeota archaeon]|nr:hypothetical protein [Candidatus Woesearchaeota archaeon]
MQLESLLSGIVPNDNEARNTCWIVVGRLKNDIDKTTLESDLENEVKENEIKINLRRNEGKYTAITIEIKQKTAAVVSSEEIYRLANQFGGTNYLRIASFSDSASKSFDIDFSEGKYLVNYINNPKDIYTQRVILEQLFQLLSIRYRSRSDALSIFKVQQNLKINAKTIAKGYKLLIDNGYAPSIENSSSTLEENRTATSFAVYHHGSENPATASRSINLTINKVRPSRIESDRKYPSLIIKSDDFQKFDSSLQGNGVLLENYDFKFYPYREPRLNDLFESIDPY